MTKTKKIIPRIIVILEITFSGPLSLTFWNKPKSPEPVKALKPSDLPLCSKDISISNIATINKIISIIHLNKACYYFITFYALLQHL